MMFSLSRGETWWRSRPPSITNWLMRVRQASTTSTLIFFADMFERSDGVKTRVTREGRDATVKSFFPFTRNKIHVSTVEVSTKSFFNGKAANSVGNTWASGTHATFAIIIRHTAAHALSVTFGNFWFENSGDSRPNMSRYWLDESASSRWKTYTALSAPCKNSIESD